MRKSEISAGHWDMESHIHRHCGRDVALSKNLSDLKRCRAKIRMCELFLGINGFTAVSSSSSFSRQSSFCEHLCESGRSDFVNKAILATGVLP